MCQRLNEITILRVYECVYGYTFIYLVSDSRYSMRERG